MNTTFEYQNCRAEIHCSLVQYDSIDGVRTSAVVNKCCNDKLAYIINIYPANTKSEPDSGVCIDLSQNI